MTRKVGSLLIFIALLAGCETSPTGRSQFMLISPATAIAESQVAYLSEVSQLAQQRRLLDDPLLQERIALVTGRLIAVTEWRYPHTASWAWSVALIDDPELNAWCMAGGRMAINSGMFHKLRLTDDELAQVMGHEIAHAVANHTAEKMSMAVAQGLGVLTVNAVTNDAALQQGAALAALLAVQLPNNRTMEAEADRMGLEFAARAGYEPYAAVTLWQKMEQQSGMRLPEFLGTHPNPGNRRERLAALAPQMRPLMPAVPPQPEPLDVIP